MAKKIRLAGKKVKPGKDKKKPLKERIEVVHVDVKAQEEYMAYSAAMIEDRFVIGNLDGLKPVMRRSLQAIYNLGLTHKAKHDKSAKAVGATLGDFHPHGDSACYEAMVTAANCSMPMIDGKGNWGSMMDREGFAAYRYTNLRLTKYGDLAFFDKFYLPVVQTIPNYDGSRPEILNLPALLPNGLLNGSFGMGPGVNTRTFSFTLRSVVKTIKKVIEDGGKATVAHCMTLDPIAEYGGYVDLEDKATRLEFKRILSGHVGNLTFWSLATDPDKNNAIRFYRFSPLPKDLDKTFEKVAAIKGVQKVEDDSESDDPYKAAVRVTFAKNLKGRELQQTLDKVEKAMSVTHRFDLKVTDRVLDAKTGNALIRLRSTNVPTMLQDWLDFRVELEKGACAYWTKKREDRVAYLKLLIRAINHLEVVYKALKVDDSHGYLVKHLKITREQADQILQLRVIQLKKLEIKNLEGEIKELQKEIAGYQERIKKPLPYIAQHVVNLYKELKDEAARQEFVVE